MWVDPDTGTWYGLVHDEFTPQPFGDGLHYDSIDYAESTDKGKTWTIEGHAITSPYSTTRDDSTAFPGQSYDYGDGDPRLYVDYASGYFYVFYSSRIVPKGGDAGSVDTLAHVARAPISGKMAAGTWQKWYNGAWSQAGVGGLESNLEPVDSTNTTGYTPVSADYSPANTGTTDAQISAGLLPSKSPLDVMNITYDAYLGLYIGAPEVVNTNSAEPQQYYVTDNLATQKWYLIGDTGSYTSDSWYRWFLDSANLTSEEFVGKSFRSYCSISCNSSGGEYATTTIASTSPASSAFTAGQPYQIASGAGQILEQVSGSSATSSVTSTGGSTLGTWTFVAVGDGSYEIVNHSTGQLLGVSASSTSTRAWGTAPTVTALAANGPTVGQEWFVVADTDPSTGAQTGTYRLVNRYSNLVLGLTAGASAAAQTLPDRSWTNTTGNSVGGSHSAAEQTLSITASGTASAVVTVSPISAQAWTQNTAVSLQASATASSGGSIAYAASGLPAGVSINASTGLISGTPTAIGTGTATVTATSGSTSGTASFTWSVSPQAVDLTGTHTLTVSGMALTDPGSSTAAAIQMDTETATGGANQNWTFTKQSDGSYTIKNGSSGDCLDDNGGATAAGTAVIQYSCTGASNQDWTAATTPSGAYTLTNEHTGLAMTTASATSGALVTQQPNTGAALQSWTVSGIGSGGTSFAAGTYVLSNVGDGMAMDMSGSSKSAGGQAIQWPASGAANQQWKFTANTDGSFTVANVGSGLCLDVTNGSVTAGAPIEQWTCTGGTNQRWKVAAVSGGYTLTAESSSLNLAAPSTTQGAQLVQATPAASTLQEWVATSAG